MCDITINSTIIALTLTLKTYKTEVKKKIYLFFVFCAIIQHKIKGVGLKVAHKDDIPVNVLSNKTKFHRFIKGLVFAFVFIGLLALLVFFIQTQMLPVKNLKSFLVNTNYVHTNTTELVHITPENESIFFEFLIPESEKESQILLYDMTYNNVDISINGEKLLFQDAKFNLNPKGSLLAYNRKDITFPVKLSIVVHPGGFLSMEDFPMIGKEDHLMFNAGVKTIFNSFMFMLVAGMGFLLAFIFIPIGIKDHYRFKSFLPVGIAMLYYGAFCYHVIFSYGGFVYFVKDVQIWSSIIPGYLASNLLFAGLEYYFLGKWKLSKIVLISNLSLFPLLFFIPQISYFLIIAVNFFFFSLLAYQSNMVFFNFLVYTRFSAEIYNLLAVTFFPYWQLDLDGVTLFVMLFGVGYFFILDFNKQNELLMTQSNELQVTNEQMYAMNEALKDEYMEIEKINNSLEETIHERTSQLRKTMNSIKTLLNNTGEGFLKFNDSLLVEPEYSAECKKIFCKNIDFHFFPALLSNSIPEGIEMTTKILRKVLKEDDSSQREVLLSLLPTVIESCNKVLSLKYRLIEEETEEDKVRKKIMVIINDITKELSLQNKLKEEKELFEDILKLITHYDEFQNLVEEYYAFWNDGSSAILNRSELTTDEKRNELFRRIHTFKGSFAIFGLTKISEKLHMIESQLAIKDQDLSLLIEEIKIGKSYDQWLERDMSKIYDYIQPGILEKQKTATLEREGIKQALDVLSTIQENDTLKKAKQILENIQLRPFEEVFETHKLLFESTAQRMGIFMDSIEINGEKTMVNGERLKPFIRSWVHIFRNIIDHGIESPEERIKKGKEIKGKIMIDIEKNDQHLMITIKDDGRGIDAEAVSKKALKKGLVTEEALKEMSTEDILNFIFEDGFSTKVILSKISGRGMGLASVKKEVEKLSGTIHVQSQKDIGTTFLFTIPTAIP